MSNAKDDGFLPWDFRDLHESLTAAMAGYGPCAPEHGPADLGYMDGGPFRIQLTSSSVPTSEPKGVTLTFPPRLRITLSTREEIDEGTIKIIERLLLECMGYRSYPVHLRSKGGKLPALRRKANVPAGYSLKRLPPIPSLLPSKIIDQPAYTRDLIEFCRLLGGRSELESVGSKHSAILRSEVRQNKIDRCPECFSEAVVEDARCTA